MEKIEVGDYEYGEMGALLVLPEKSLASSYCADGTALTTPSFEIMDSNLELRAFLLQ